MRRWAVVGFRGFEDALNDLKNSLRIGVTRHLRQQIDHVAR
jgi:hypothetical protein